MKVIFSYHKGSILSKMICWMTNSNVSHASIRFDGDEDNWMVEAAARGVQPGWWNYFIKNNEVVHVFESNVGITEEELEKIVDECLDDMVGKKYDIFGIIGFAIAIGLKKLGVKEVKNIFGSKKLYFCSELVMKIFQKVSEKIGRTILEGDPELTSPYDLYVKCQSSIYFIDKSPKLDVK